MWQRPQRQATPKGLWTGCTGWPPKGFDQAPKHHPGHHQDQLLSHPLALLPWMPQLKNECLSKEGQEKVPEAR
eukprot:422905-Pelagomonas_calceolata.AAC.1